ncbi:MAG TPA: YncE family protein [Pyrinomonadaceae bacterium]|nr:YncE family protein [Pyrinomonadaceae bacterium]
MRQQNSFAHAHTAINRVAFILLLLFFAPRAAVAQAKSGELLDAHGNPAELTVNKKTPTPTSAPSAHAQRFEREGVAIDFSVQALPRADGSPAALVAGADALATFRVTDARTGQPLAGLKPNAWFSARRGEGRAPDAAQCRDKIRTFMGGLLSVRPDVDLNSYLLLTLNHDNTITIINPQLSFNVTKLESVVVLPATGADWALSRDKQFLYVTMPEQAAVAVVNVVTRKLVSTIPTGEGTRPLRASLHPDGRFLWVGLDNSPLVAVIDTTTNKLRATVGVGAGLHTFAFTPDGRYVYVTNSTADTVTAIDAETLAKLAEIPVGRTPVPIAHSSASRFVYVAGINDTHISVIDPARQKVVGRVAVGRGTVALAFEPEGRYGFAVNQVESTLSVFDASTNAVLATAQVVKSPDQISFTRGYAYVRGAGSEKFSLVQLSEAKQGKLAPVEIAAGQRPPSASPADIGVAGMIQPTPEGNSVMVASAPDQMIYYYVEGTMAPMGTLQNYKRRPRGLMILDRSLAETAPGVYSSPVRLTRAGRFDVPVVFDQPRLVNCFELEVGEAPGGERKRGAGLLVESLFKEVEFAPQRPYALRFKITDGETKQPVAGLTDVLVMAFEPPGLWQQRQWAKEVSAGVYEITQTFPKAVPYTLMVAVPSRRLRFSRATATELLVRPETKTAAKD